MKEKTWYLMRHGETNYNKERRFYGRCDIPINDTGRKQAISLANCMINYPIESLYTSALIRSQQTAQIAFPNQSFQSLSDFDERDFGRWEGLTADEIQASFAQDWQDWLTSPFEVTPSRAESFAAFQERVWRRMCILEASSYGRIGIVAHLGVLRLMYQYLVDQTEDFWSIDIPQGTVLRIKIDEAGAVKTDYLKERIKNEE